jgi:hypothetical protein
MEAEVCFLAVGAGQRFANLWRNQHLPGMPAAAIWTAP